MKMLKVGLGLIFSLFLVAGLYLTFRNHYRVELRPARLQQAALADLALITNAEKTFHEIYGTYTTDLSSLGVNPKYVYYKIGFLRPSQVPVPNRAEHRPEVMNLEALKEVRKDLKLQFSKETKLGEIDFASLVKYCEDCTATSEKFKAVAAANLDEDETLDIWTVDHEGKYQHVIDDLK